MITKFLSELNEKQLQAVTAPRQPVLLIAGPGTGKTRTLIARIYYQIENFRVDPAQILALTFSNKAAREIRQRLEKNLKERAAKIRSATFHSFCLDMIRKNHELLGLKRNFSVCDEDYQKRLLKQILQGRLRENIDKKINGILLAFSLHILKNKTLPPFSANIYDEYKEHLKKHNLIDYDQILIHALNLLAENPDILNQYRFLNQAILVDEFQDTDPVQYQIVQLLAELHRNIFAVADDDQSIYSWRGANPENIRRFMADFNIKKPLFLDRNYRSGKGIMDTAQKIVQTTDRIEPEKVVQSAQDDEAQIRVLFFDDEAQECHFIANRINDWYKNQHIPLSEIAIIYPRHQFGERISGYLLKQRIAHQQALGKNLIDHPLMQKVVLYLKLIREPSDSLILEELVENELGYNILKQVQQIRNSEQISFRKALSELGARQNISYDVRRQINTLIGNIANLVNLKSFFTFKRLIDEIIKATQEFSVSVLNQQASKLKSYETSKINDLQKPDRAIWLYHGDDRLEFIAKKMLDTALAKPVRILSQDKLIHVAKNDLILLLNPFAVENLPCRYVTLFQSGVSRRNGILSQLFRWLQVQLRLSNIHIFEEYVAFDLETTGKNTETDRIVEIAAVKVIKGKIVAEFQSLINPQMPIDPEATEIHHITDADVKDAPLIEEIWPEFIQFIDKHLLIAHNGYAFDFKIIDRVARDLKKKRISNIRYDSLILARNLFSDAQNSIDGLVDRFKLDSGVRHRALDDVKVLHEIFQRLLATIDSRETRTCCEDLCEFVALGNALENQVSATEDRVLFMAGIRKLLSPYSVIRKQYAAEFNTEDMELTEQLMRVKEKVAPNLKLYDTHDDFFKRTLDIASEFNSLEIDSAIAAFLSNVALINPQDCLSAIDAVSLLTYHSAKGLEFERIILVGVEDEQMPSFFAYKDDTDDERPVAEKLQEQKRLFYVGVTRAKKEVIMTLVKNRFGRRQRSSPFLEEIKDFVTLEPLR